MLFGNNSDIFLGFSFLSFGDRIREGERCCLQIMHFIFLFFLLFSSFLCVKHQEPKCVFSLFYTYINAYGQTSLFKYDTWCLNCFMPYSLYVWFS